MTIEEIEARERAAREKFERETVGAVVDGRPVVVAELRCEFDDAVREAGAGHWKDGFTVVRAMGGKVLVAAIEFYHGATPAVRPVPGSSIGSVEITTRGYAC